MNQQWKNNKVAKFVTIKHQQQCDGMIKTVATIVTWWNNYMMKEHNET
jgi:hypothetical protein